MAGPDTLDWLAVDRLAEALVDAHPDLDPVSVSFPKLKSLVLALPGFREEPGRPCNERILEAIQQAWIDARD
jgi:FeS assembly protein IscX